MYIIKTAPALQGLRLAAGVSGRQARSLQETSVVWLRQSAAHNWPVTSTQQDSIHARARQESTRPFGNIQIFTRFSLLVTKTVTKAYSRLFTNSILDMVKAEVDWLGGGVCRGRVATAAYRVPD